MASEYCPVCGSRMRFGGKICPTPNKHVAIRNVATRSGSRRGKPNPFREEKPRQDQQGKKEKERW